MPNIVTSSLADGRHRNPASVTVHSDYPKAYRGARVSLGLDLRKELDFATRINSPQGHPHTQAWKRSELLLQREWYLYETHTRVQELISNTTVLKRCYETTKYVHPEAPI